jgi:hypothetical protein
VLYGNSLEKAHIDIIGSSISVASKILSIAKPNQVLVGEFIYIILRSSEFKINLIEINLDPTYRWHPIDARNQEAHYLLTQSSGLKDLFSFSITYIALIIFLAAAIMAILSYRIAYYSI